MNKNLETIIKPYLPLKIDDYSWDECILNFYGRGWSFYAIASWRICKENIIVQGDIDQDIDLFLKDLFSYQIVNIKIFNNDDVKLFFSNELYIEIFSNTYLEPWVLSLTEELGIKNMIVFTGSPSTK